MKKRGEMLKIGYVGVMVVGLLCLSTHALGFEKLKDAELDAITAGTASMNLEEEMARFEFSKGLRNGGMIQGEGSLSLKIDKAQQVSLNSLVLRDSAQQNLRALVNINAVNSPIQVLLNLNINVNSNIGTVRQFNLSNPVP